MRSAKGVSLTFTYIVVFGSFVSLYGFADSIYLLLFFVGTLYGAINDFLFKRHFPRHLLTLVGFLASGYFLLDLSMSNLIQPFANVLILLICIKALEEKRPRDIYQLLLLSLFGTALTATFRFDLSFMVFFLYELFLGTVAFMFTTVYASYGDKKLSQEFLSRYIRFSLLFPLAVFVLAIPFFLLLPRTHTPVIDMLATKKEGLKSGIAQKVELDKVGEIQEDNTVVMRVYGTLPPTAYWRVSVFDRYVGTKWIRSANIEEGYSRVRNSSSSRVYRYRVILMPTYDTFLPLLDHPVGVRRVEGYRGTFRRVKGGYYIGTRPISKPIRYVGISSTSAPTDPPEYPDHLSVPEDLPDSIRELAGELSEGARGDLGKVMNVIAFFKRDFRYSLRLGQYEGDPVEHFLFRSKSGNCEFFASSTALLLRLMGVPARLVGGFKGYIKNDLGDYYIVTNSMAHVWVEAWVNGAWMRVDTTPPYRSPAVRSISRFDLFKDAVLSFWYENVVDYSVKTQSAFLRNLKLKLEGLKNIDVDRFVREVFLFASLLVVAGYSLYFVLFHLRRTPVNLYRKMVGRLERRYGKRIRSMMPEEILTMVKGTPIEGDVEYIVRLYQRYRFSSHGVEGRDIKEGYRVLRNI